MSDKNSEIESFLSEVAENTPTGKATAFPSRDRLKADFGTLYEGYIVESYKGGITGEYGESTVVNMIDTNNISLRLDGHGDDVLIPAVPDDQLPE